MASPKCLSIRQPWAWAILHVGKTVENRTWQTSYRGPLLIHAGQKIDWAGYELLDSLELPLPDPDTVARGGIIGQMNLMDCIKDAPGPWSQPDCWHWLLAEPQELRFVPCAGRLGLFELAL